MSKVYKYYIQDKSKILKSKTNYNICGIKIDNKLISLIYEKIYQSFTGKIDQDIYKNKKLYLKVKKVAIEYRNKLSADGSDIV